MKSDNAELRERIKKAIRDNPDLNQKVVADRVGCSPGYISLLLNNQKKGDLALLAKIATVVGIKRINIDGFEIYQENSVPAIESESPPHESNHIRDSPEAVKGLIDMALKLLESDSHWGDLLALNIESFHRGMVQENGDRRKSDQPDKIPTSGDRRKAVG